MSPHTPLPAAAQALPTVSISLVDGSSTDNTPSKGRWLLLLIVHRGKHCGRCATYFNWLEKTPGEWRYAGFDIGLYVSDPLSPEENDRRFAEPDGYGVRDDGTVRIAAMSNGPSARPDLAELLDSMIFTIENGKPARGMA
jgi:hypothetical protein